MSAFNCVLNRCKSYTSCIEALSNITNGDEDGIQLIEDENLCVRRVKSTRSTYRSTLSSMPTDSSSTSSSSKPSTAPSRVINILTFPEFDLHPKDTAHVRFEKYVKRLDNMFTAMDITRASQEKAK